MSARSLPRSVPRDLASDRTPTTRSRPGSRSRSDRPMKVSELMGEDPVIELDHEGQIYRLRITRNRKLILTK